VRITLGQRIKVVRKCKHISQARLGASFGKSARTINRYERDQGIPNSFALEHMADCLGVTLDYLMGDDYIKNIPDKGEKADKADKADKPEDKIGNKCEMIRMSLLDLLEEPTLTDDDAADCFEKLCNIFFQFRRRRKMASGNQIGTKIKSLREQNGWSQSDLAQHLGVTASAVGTWESGKAMTREAQRQRLADALGVTKDELFGNMETAERVMGSE